MHFVKKWKNQSLIGMSLFLALSLVGCGAKDNTPIPKPLTSYPFGIHPQVLWSTAATSGSGLGTQLGLGQNSFELVTAGYKGSVVALNKKTGNILWSVDLREEISASPVANESDVYISTRSGEVIALDARTGKTLWKVSVSSTLLSAVAISGDTLIVHERNGNVEALSADTGARLWEFMGSTPSLELQGSSRPVANDATAYVGMANGQVFAFDLSDGAVKWDRPIAIADGSTMILRMIDINSTPILTSTALYAVSYHGNLVSLDPDSGQLIWQRPLSAYRSLEMAGSSLFVTDENSVLYGVDANSGRTLFRQNALEYRSLTAPLYCGNELWVGDYDGYVHALSPRDGHLEARVHLGNYAMSSGAVKSGNVAYFVNVDGKVFALKC